MAAVVAALFIALTLLIPPYLLHQFAFMPRSLGSDRVLPSYWGLPHGKLTRIRSGKNALLVGWWIPHQNPDRLACGTVLMLAGNMGNITDRVRTATALGQRGVDVLLFDYRGFGASTGTPTEAVLYEDAFAAYNEAISRTAGGPEKLVLFAHSLGGVPAVQLGARSPVAGMILLAPYASVRHAIVSKSALLEPLTWLIPDSAYAPVRHAAAAKAPVLIASGGRDRYLDRQTADSLFSSFPGRKWRVHVPSATHNGVLGDPDVWREVDRFLYRFLPCD